MITTCTDMTCNWKLRSMISTVHYFDQECDAEGGKSLGDDVNGPEIPVIFCGGTLTLRTLRSTSPHPIILNDKSLLITLFNSPTRSNWVRCQFDCYACTHFNVSPTSWLKIKDTKVLIWILVLVSTLSSLLNASSSCKRCQIAWITQWNQP